ncbi:cupin domain-containing protein [Pseudomonas sp. CNPSo 3701]|uniref:cupin domain-containing protein n=1 Tax=Pseudomonas sp. CNPSo 3701 TaxID=3027943 RepID=UPI00236330C6|nr:cupin domain-containing protein [Pseudomonas sp. CNPSo 3701]MDD1509021.1 cupin domain-containing protein [Pseudomonas sp. CNPSo 3701]
MTITHFRDTASASLDDHNPVAVPLSEPAAITSVTCVERDDGVETGIWECTPGRCTFIPDVGEPIEIKAGDALMLPANTTGVWDIQETLRKTYVLIF